LALPESITAGVTTGHATHHVEVHKLLNSIGFNVKDPDFGAVGDGTADDTVAINAALAAVPATGGVVYLPAGRYKVTSPLLIQQEATMVVGAGAGQKAAATQDARGTRIEIAAGFSGTEVIRVQRAANDRPLYGVTLRDFAVDGGLVGTVDGILYRSNAGLVEHVHVHRMGGNGFRLLGYATWATYDTTLNLVQADDCGAAGVLFDTDSTDAHLKNSVISDNNDNVIVKAGSLQLVGNHFYGPTRYNIFFDGGGSRTKIIANKAESSGQHNVLVDSTNGGYSDIQIIGNGFSTSGFAANNTYDHLLVTGPSGNGISRMHINGNQFGSKSGTTNFPRYGLNLDTSAVRLGGAFGNSFGPASQFGTAAVRNNSDSSQLLVVRHNPSWITEASGTVAVGSGSATATVTHGLSVTPAAKDVRLNFSADPLAANKLWASGFTSTQFTVNVGTAPGGAGTTVAWEAQVL
jgi:Pectate lyase superfamily protein